MMMPSVKERVKKLVMECGGKRAPVLYWVDGKSDETIVADFMSIVLEVSRYPIDGSKCRLSLGYSAGEGVR